MLQASLWVVKEELIEGQKRRFMPWERETRTDRLTSIIQVLQLGRKTGLLTIERGEGETFEEGTITFVDGQITQAHSGYIAGQEAFDWLSTWGPCLFAFINTPEDHSVYSQEPENRLIDTETRMSTRSLESERHNGLHVMRNSAHHERKLPGNSTLIPTIPPHIDASLRKIEVMGLSRAHRQVFLLVDGHRTSGDIARLTRRRPREVYTLLLDLEGVGVIQL
jgi:Domain of unknown function (DUF4388)